KGVGGRTPRHPAAAPRVPARSGRGSLEATRRPSRTALPKRPRAAREARGTARHSRRSRGGGLRVRSRRGVRSVRKRGASAKRKRGGPGAAELNDKGGAGSERCGPRAQPSARGERQRKRKALGPGNTPGRA